MLNISSNFRAKYSKIKYQKSDTYHYEDNPAQNATFRKDYTTLIIKLLTINPFLEDSFIKLGTDNAYREKVCTFVDSIPAVGQQQ